MNIHEIVVSAERQSWWGLNNYMKTDVKQKGSLSKQWLSFIEGPCIFSPCYFVDVILLPNWLNSTSTEFHE